MDKLNELDTGKKIDFDSLPLEERKRLFKELDVIGEKIRRAIQVAEEKNANNRNNK